MTSELVLHKDRLFPADDAMRKVAADLYETTKALPILSPHGHTDPSWFSDNQPFGNAHELLVKPDHYLFRMLYSQGIRLSELGFSAAPGDKVASPREAWRTFASHFYLFRGTPSALWLNHVFADVFKLDVMLEGSTADHYFDAIGEALTQPEFLPRTLFEKFNIELLATTESPTDELRHHKKLRSSDWNGNVVTTYRPDAVIDAEHESFKESLELFAGLTGEDVSTWRGYLQAHRLRRAEFSDMGATATDHGHATVQTANLTTTESEKLFHLIIGGQFNAQEAELFRAQMLTEMAKMSIDDGLVMQIHPGSYRNHNQWLFKNYGRDMGADIPQRTEYVQSLKPLLDLLGNNADLSIILFTLDESNYSRELAPLAGHYPCLKLGPSWWFQDSPEGMMRFREQVIETAGFYNTVGFNDDTRAFLSIPARHDVARRVDASFLARLVCEHRMDESEAYKVAADLTYHLPKQAYKLD